MLTVQYVPPITKGAIKSKMFLKNLKNSTCAWFPQIIRQPLNWGVGSTDGKDPIFEVSWYYCHPRAWTWFQDVSCFVSQAVGGWQEHRSGMHWDTFLRFMLRINSAPPCITFTCVLDWTPHPTPFLFDEYASMFNKRANLVQYISTFNYASWSCFTR